MNVAQFCLASESNDECSVEDKDALIHTLQEQGGYLENIDSLLQRLRISRDNTPASRERIDALIKSIELVTSDRMEVRYRVVSTRLNASHFCSSNHLSFYFIFFHVGGTILFLSGSL